MGDPIYSENIKSINNDIRVFARRAAKHIAKHASYYMMCSEVESFSKWRKRYDKLTEKWIAATGSAGNKNLDALMDRVSALIDRMICVKDIPK
ncbi:MAG: hypothetical protein LBL21_00860 [Rickettsiales bacterium]|jgi:hypothetical protein|nr:hypothetical protein [Rickettsiales bacterium]